MLVQLRQAVALGTNTQDMIDTMGEDGGTPLVGAVSPVSGWAYNEDLDPYPYDPEDGRELAETESDMQRVVRGGSWSNTRSNALA